jgi:hypothetical protein
MTYQRLKYGAYAITAMLGGLLVYTATHKIQVTQPDFVELVEGVNERAIPIMGSWPDISSQKVENVIWTALTNTYTVYHQDGTSSQQAYLATNSVITNWYVYTNWTYGFYFETPVSEQIGRQTNGLPAYTNGPPYNAIPIQTRQIVQAMADKVRALIPHYCDFTEAEDLTYSYVPWYTAHPASNTPPMLTVKRVFSYCNIGNGSNLFSFEVNTNSLYVNQKDFIELYKAIWMMQVTMYGQDWWRCIGETASLDNTYKYGASNQTYAAIYPSDYTITNQTYFNTDNITSLWPQLEALYIDNFGNDQETANVVWTPNYTNTWPGCEPKLNLDGSGSITKQSYAKLPQFNLGVYNRLPDTATNRLFTATASGERANSWAIYSNFPPTISRDIFFYSATYTNDTQYDWEIFDSRFLGGQESVYTSSVCQYPGTPQSSLTVNFSSNSLYADGKANQVVTFDVNTPPPPYVMFQGEIGTQGVQSATISTPLSSKKILPTIIKWEFERCTSNIN